MDNAEGISARLAKNETFVPDVGSNTQLVGQVFTMFKEYLSSQLEAKDKHLEQKSKTTKETSELNFKGNRKQFELNSNLSRIFSLIEQNIDNPSEIQKLVQDGHQLIKKRQKFIRLANRSKDGWRVVQEHESDDLASDSEDEKRIRKAEKKTKENKKQVRPPARRFKSVRREINDPK